MCRWHKYSASRDCAAVAPYDEFRANDFLRSSTRLVVLRSSWEATERVLRQTRSESRLDIGRSRDTPARPGTIDFQIPELGYAGHSEWVS